MPSRYAAEPTEDEETTTASSEYSEDDEYSLLGSLKTQVQWDAADKQLGVTLRQSVQTARKIELKYKGHLNTGTGDYHTHGYLRKNFNTNTPSLQKVFTAARLQAARQRGDPQIAKEAGRQLEELGIDPDRLLPAGLGPLVLRDWIISPGATYDSARAPGSSHLRYALFVRKAPQVLLHSPRTDLFLSAKGALELDSHSTKASAFAGLRLKLFKYNVTSKQDLKVSVGVDWEVEPLANTASASSALSKAVTQSTYLKISENNTSIKLQKGRWSFLYEL